MLELEVEIDQDLAGDLATRIMALWPGLEVKPEGKSVWFFLPVDNEIDSNLKKFEQALQTLEKVRHLPLLHASVRNLAGPDSGPESFSLGRFQIKHPEAESGPEPGRMVMNLKAGQAFGTGGHPSTALALAALEDYFEPAAGLPSRAGSRVLDVGTGSGILALAAALLGTGPVTAVDSAPEAVAAAEENTALNGLESRLRISRIEADRLEGEYDLVLANLVTAVMLKTGKKLARLLAPQGTIIASGFADSQAPQVVKALTAPGLDVSKSYSRAGWSALTLTRS